MGKERLAPPEVEERKRNKKRNICTLKQRRKKIIFIYFLYSVY